MTSLGFVDNDSRILAQDDCRPTRSVLECQRRPTGDTLSRSFHLPVAVTDGNRIENLNKIRSAPLDRLLPRSALQPETGSHRLPNLHTVFDWYVCPGLTMVDGNAG